MRGRALRRLAVGLLALPGLGCASLELLERDWIRVRTRHLEIVSALPAERTLALAESLALFRNFVVRLSPHQEVAPRLPTVVHLTDPSFIEELRGGGVAGFFWAGTRDNLLVTYGGGFRGSQRMVLLHEYAHYLLSNQQSASYPVWFNEGWAQFLSTVDERDGLVSIGRIPHLYLYALQHERWIPIRRLLELREYPESGLDRTMFYLESMALVHYLQLGRPDRGRTVAQLGRYLKRIASGEPDGEAFAAAFGRTPEQVEQRLHRYVGGDERVPSLLVPREEFGEIEALRAEPASRADVAGQLGWILLRFEQPRRARGYFQAALRERPDFARAHAGLGAALAQRGDWDAAQRHLERALALAPDDPLGPLDLANALHTRAEADEEDRARWLAAARERYAASLALDPDLPEAHLQLGATWLLEGEDAEAGVPHLERALALLPANLEIGLALAKAYVRTDRRVRAERMLTRLLAFSHGEALREEAEELLAELAEVSD